MMGQTLERCEFKIHISLIYIFLNILEKIFPMIMMWFCGYVKLFNSRIYVNIIQAILARKKYK